MVEAEFDCYQKVDNTHQQIFFLLNQSLDSWFEINSDGKKKNHSSGTEPYTSNIDWQKMVNGLTQSYSILCGRAGLFLGLKYRVFPLFSEFHFWINIFISNSIKQAINKDYCSIDYYCCIEK